MAKSKKRRWLEHREYANRHQLRDAKTGKMLLCDVTRAEIDAYIAKVKEADGMIPEISYDRR
jgi:hypothetical protein